MPRARHALGLRAALRTRLRAPPPQHAGSRRVGAAGAAGLVCGAACAAASLHRKTHCAAGSEAAAAAAAAAASGIPAAEAVAVMVAPVLALVGATAFLFGDSPEKGRARAADSANKATQQAAPAQRVAPAAAAASEDKRSSPVEGTPKDAPKAAPKDAPKAAPKAAPKSQPKSQPKAARRQMRQGGAKREADKAARKRSRQASELTKASVAALFEEFDANRDGRLDEEELKDLAFACGLALDKASVEQCLKELDADHDGTVDQEELAAWLVGQGQEEGRQRLADVPLELRARLTARQYSRQAGKVANAALGPILAGEDMDPGGLRARPQTGTLKTREESDRIRASLDRLTLLDSVGPAKKELMVKAIKTRHYATGETVFSQGALADGFYIIERGSLRVMEQSEETGSAPVEKRVLKSGVCFGELALIHSSRRTASVEAVENSVVFVLKPDDFKAIIGPQLSLLRFTQWTSAPAVVSGQPKSMTPPKLGPKASKQVFHRDSLLEAFRRRKMLEYEARLRRLSSREKVFAYFASVETDDGSQMMSPADFLRALGVLHPDAELDAAGEKFFREADADGDGLISFTEYSFFRSILAIDPTDFAIAFHMFDTNGDGRIDKAEFSRMFGTLSRSSTSSKAWAEMLNGPVFKGWFGELGTESINFEEFRSWLHELHVELCRLEFLNYANDTNHDGVVDSLSAADFGQMVVLMVSAAGYGVAGHKERLKQLREGEQQLAAQRVNMEDFLAFAAVLRSLETVEQTLDLGGNTGKVDRPTLERAVDAALDVTLPPTIVAVLFCLLDEDGDGLLSREELFGALRQRRETRSQNRASILDCIKKCGQ